MEKKRPRIPNAVVSGTLLVNTLPTHVLFDAGATNSFINLATAKGLTYKLDEMDVRLRVTTLVGSVYQTKAVVRNYAIVVYERVFFLLI